LKKNCIIVPVYKELRDLSNGEFTSLVHLFKILGKHQIFFIGPTTIKWNRYLSEAERNNSFPKVREFENKYFSSLKGYSKLMISLGFFNAFKKYNYMLVYQLDSMVFRDELEYWCNKGYDYIGAPWFDKDDNGKEYLNDVGNGGFSLRNTNKSLKLLKELRYKEVFDQYKYLNWKGIIPRIPKLFVKLIKSRNIPSILENNFEGHEDGFWCRVAPAYLRNFNCNSKILEFIYSIAVTNSFKIAPVNKAIQFSFEVNPQELYAINNKKLPFGCHAWEKRNPEFWKEFISTQQDNVSINEQH
jgi:hypothetical protein